MHGFKFSIIGTICLAIAAPLGAQSSQPSQPTKLSDLEEAKAALAAGKADAALALVDPIIAAAEAKDAKDPDAICPSNAAAIALAFMGAAGKNVTVTVENDWCDAMLVRGYALGELKRFDDATATLAKLVKHDANNANYLAEYAFALRSSGNADEAFRRYQQVGKLAVNYKDKAAKQHWRAVALRGIGFIEFDRKNWDLAERAYRDSLKQEPGNAIALSELEAIRQTRSR
ncbi:MAG: hypothetical protein JSR96_09880 [Proteobacteria bacterium]|nr:hypothetical protein [Pseudomonadota bacterium]